MKKGSRLRFNMRIRSLPMLLNSECMDLFATFKATFSNPFSAEYKKARPIAWDFVCPPRKAG